MESGGGVFGRLQLKRTGRPLELIRPTNPIRQKWDSKFEIDQKLPRRIAMDFLRTTLAVSKRNS
jgi:hypothetical protein